MAEKKTRNKFKDMMWDYYLTNRGISKEYEKSYEEQPKNKKWTGNEKLYLVLIIIAGIAALIRFVIL